jgi:aspartate racemase
MCGIDRRTRLGVIGGVGPAASADLYLRLVAAYRERADGDYPDLIMRSLPLPALLDHAFVTATEEPAHEAAVLRMLEDTVDLLTEAGATAVAVPCNTLHRYLPRLFAGRRIVGIDMIAATRQRIATAGYHRVLLLATSSTLRSGLYRSGDGVSFVHPAPELQALVEQLVHHCIEHPDRPAPETGLRRVLADAGPVDAVLLGCTDLTVLRDSSVFGVPVVDSLSCLVAAGCEHLSTPGDLQLAGPAARPEVSR